MADLDDELRDALQSSEDGAPPASALEDAPAVSAGSQLAPDEAPKRNLGLLLGLLVVVGGILALVFTSVDDAAIYSLTTDVLVQDQEQYQGRNVRVAGDLVNGSLRFRKEPCEYRFAMTKNGKQLKVRYPSCVVPDTFKDVPGIDVEVTAEGKINSEGHFDATLVLAKCPSKYEMQQRAGKGEEVPHDMMGAPPTIEEE